MPRIASRLLIAGIVLAAPSALTSCTIVDGPSEDLAEEVAVTLASHDGTITILAPGESLPCLNCELQNIHTRTVRIRMEEGQTFQFRAYFGGNLRDERSCKWHGEHTIMVDWQNGELNCINWTPA